MVVLGWQLETTSQIEWRLLTLAGIAGFSLLFLIPVRALFAFASIRERSVSGAHSVDRVSHSFRIISLLIFVVPQVIVFLAIYPGMYGYDGAFHIAQITPDGTDNLPSLSTGWSIMYTFYLGGAVAAGKTVATAQLGFAVAMFIQALISCLVLWFVVIWLRNKTGSRVLAVCALIAFALSPHAMVLRISSSQDTFFADFFLLTAVFLVEIFMCAKQGKDVPLSYLAACSLCATLMMLLRGNGLYAYMLVLLLSFVLTVMRRLQIRVLVSLLIPVLLYGVVSGPVYRAIGASDSGHPAINEMLSVPSQQFARSYVDKPWTFDKREQRQIDAFYSRLSDKADFSFYWDIPEIADSAKVQIDPVYTKKHFGEYLGLWFIQGLEDPENYVEAFLLNTLGYWYPGKSYPDTRIYHPFVEYEMMDAKIYNKDYTDIPRDGKLPAVEGTLDSFYLDSAYGSIPVISVLLSNGIWFWAFIVLGGIALYLHRGIAAPVLLLEAGLFVTFLLSPVCLYRYVYPFQLVLPVLVASILIGGREHIACGRAKAAGDAAEGAQHGILR